MDTAEVSDRLLSYIRETFLGGDPQAELDESTPLLEWGILTSMNTAVLLTFVHTELGVDIPPDRINGEHFKDVRSIAGLVRDLSGVHSR